MTVQPDLFPKPAVAMPAPRMEEARAVLTSCPRCAKAKTDAWGWVVTLNGPFQGVRCGDCWEAEPCES